MDDFFHSAFQFVADLLFPVAKPLSDPLNCYYKLSSIEAVSEVSRPLTLIVPIHVSEYCFQVGKDIEDFPICFFCFRPHLESSVVFFCFLLGFFRFNRCVFPGISVLPSRFFFILCFDCTEREYSCLDSSQEDTFLFK